MKDFDHTINAVKLLCSPIGILPKVNGSYLSRAGLNNSKEINLGCDYRKKTNSIDIQFAKKRLLWELKKQSYQQQLPSLYKKQKNKRRAKTQKTCIPQGSQKSVHVVKLSDNIRIRHKSGQPKHMSLRNADKAEKNNQHSHQNSQVFIQPPAQQITISSPKQFSSKNKHKIRVNHPQIDALEHSPQYSSITPKLEQNTGPLKSERSKINDSLMKRRSAIERWKERINSSVLMGFVPGQWQRWEYEEHLNLQHLIDISNEKQYRLETE